MVTKIEADLYSLAGTALVVSDGFAFKATNDACVKVIDGKIMATKFGLKRTGPDFVIKTRNEAEEYGKKLYDRIKKGVTLELYYGDKYYVPSTLDRVSESDKDYALYDKETDRIYRVEFDNINRVYNLIGVCENTIMQVETDNLQPRINQKYVPLVGIRNQFES